MPAPVRGLDVKYQGDTKLMTVGPRLSGRGRDVFRAYYLAISLYSSLTHSDRRA